MKQFRIRYDRTAQKWSVENVEMGKRALVARIKLDADAHAEVGGVLACTGELVIDGDGVRLADTRKPRGTPKPKEMREWCVMFDEGTARWVVFREDKPEIVVTTENLDVECHGITAGDKLHCLAEMLLNGRTNRDLSVIDAVHVRLRTLEVFDQVVQVPLVASMGARALSPVGVKRTE